VTIETSENKEERIITYSAWQWYWNLPLLKTKRRKQLLSWQLGAYLQLLKTWKRKQLVTPCENGNLEFVTTKTASVGPFSSGDVGLWQLKPTTSENEEEKTCSYSMRKWKSAVRENENCERRHFLKRRRKLGRKNPSLAYTILSTFEWAKWGQTARCSHVDVGLAYKYTREGFEFCKWPKAEGRAGPQFACDIRPKVRLAFMFDKV